MVSRLRQKSKLFFAGSDTVFAGTVHFFAGVVYIIHTVSAIFFLIYNMWLVPELSTPR